MLAVGRFISRGVHTVSGPFQPFGGAIDIIVVEQPDGCFKSSPRYVKFRKFQGILKSREKVVDICVNDVDLHMFLDHKGEAFFLREVDVEEGKSVVVQSLSLREDTEEQMRGARRPIKSQTYNFDSRNSCSVDQDNLSSTTKVLTRNGSCRTRFLGYVFGKRSMKEKNVQEIDAGSEVARTDSLERAENAADLLEVNWSTSLAIDKPKKGKASRFSSVDVLNDDAGTNLQIDGKESCISSFPQDFDDNNLTQCILDFDEITGGCDPPLQETGLEGTNAEMSASGISIPAEDMEYSSGSCYVEERCDTASESINERQPGYTQSKVKERNTLYQISGSESCVSACSELCMSSRKQFRDAHDYDENDVTVGDKASGKENKGDRLCSETSGKSDCEQTHNDLYLSREESRGDPVQDDTLSEVTDQLSETEHLREHGVAVSKESSDGLGYTRESYNWTSEENGVDARIYLWKWNTRIIISDVDGTITRSDVLGQFMPMVRVDWSHIGVAHLYSAIKENGFDLLFLSARAISQAYLTRQFLFNFTQDGKTLPDGAAVISSDGLFPSLYREVIRRAPHDFKIACLETIRELFPPDSNPFYAGFGNRDTDEISYLRVGIPKGKKFTINPKGEVAVLRRVDTKSYTSLHALVNGIFLPTNTTEQEDFNEWNFWSTSSQS